MTDRIQGPGGIAPQQAPRTTRRRPADAGFNQALENLLRQTQTPAAKPSVESGEADEIRFSRHAKARLESRGLEVDAAEMERLQNAAGELEKKGAKEALVITGNAAYILGVEKRTVITAMPRAEALGQVFTQIDSTFVTP